MKRRRPGRIGPLEWPKRRACRKRGRKKKEPSPVDSVSLEFLRWSESLKPGFIKNLQRLGWITEAYAKAALVRPEA
jgi:hypothetical protein